MQGVVENVSGNNFVTQREAGALESGCVCEVHRHSPPLQPRLPPLLEASL